MTLVDVSPRTIPGLDATVGAFAFGLWRFTHDDVGHARDVLEVALECGMNLVDDAAVYGLDWGGTGFGSNEELLGRVLAADPSLRDRIVLATKGGILPPTPYDSSAASLRSECEDSLRRLGVDVIDLYQVHRPDLYTHPAELAATLVALRDEGKIRAIGVSNFTAPQHCALIAHLADAGAVLATTQPELSPAHLGPIRDGVFDTAMQFGVTPLTWSPLAGGRIVSGEGLRPDLVATLDRLAEREGVDRATIALAFVLAHPARPVAIVGSQTPDRIRASLRAGDVALDRNDCYDIIEASEGVPLP